LTSQTQVPTEQIELSVDPPNRTAVFTFVGGRPKGILTDGNYRAALFSRGVNTADGTPLDGNEDGLRGGDHAFHFHHLTGDADRNRSVDFADLVTLAQNYGTSRRTFSTGDFDYDDDCDFADLVLLAQRYNTSLPREGAVAAPTADAIQRPVLNPDVTTRPTKTSRAKPMTPLRRPTRQ
jgi:hypothetical protein